VIIALVTETYPPEVNGVAFTLQRLADGLIARGHTVQLVRPRRGSDESSHRPNRLQELLVPGVPLPFYRGLHLGLPARRRLLSAWRAARPDIVHVATEGLIGWSAIRAARTLGIPVVSSYHTNFHLYCRHYGAGLLQRLIFWYLRRFHNRTLATFVPTPTLRRHLSRHHFANLRILARGVDTALFAPVKRAPELRRAWGADERTPVALYVGRLAAEKNLPLAVEAYLRFQKRAPGARFVLVGDGPLRAKLEARHPEFQFAGYRRGEDLAAHYASADFFLFPSLTETFGNVVIEAMASGLPVIAFRNGAAAEHIRPGQSGLLAPKGNAAEFLTLAESMKPFSSASVEMGAAARRIALNLSWTEVIDGFEDDLKRLSGDEQENWLTRRFEAVAANRAAARRGMAGVAK